jgi:N-methylhydantoinase A/acetophenone carboxylase
MVRQVIETEYPAHYLGAVPIFLSTEAGATLDDFCRTNAALLNAYCQRDTAKFLYEAEDVIKQLGHTRPLLVLHTEGGVAKVCKSTPLTCIHSDQVANYLTLAQIGKLCGEKEIVALDMGGSGMKACLLEGNNYIYNRTPAIDDIPLKTPILEFAPLAKGGHCVAEVNNNAIRLGVETLEPACYGARGDKPTVTDACVTLGLIARNDLNSVKAMNTEKARQVITDALARPLGISPEEAARMVLSEVKAAAVLLLKALVENKEVNMEHVTLFCLGGMSGIFCCDVAQQLGISRIYCPPMSWAFSALGCIFAPVLHSYEMCAKKVIRGSASPKDRDWFNGIVQGLENIACRDMMGEGFSADKLSFVLELEATTNSSQGVIEAPRVLETEGNMVSLFESFAKELRQSAPIDELAIELFRLRTAGPMNPYQFSTHESANKDPQKAFREEIDIYMDNALRKVAVYRREMLECGNVVTGPALIQSQGDTVFVPSGKAYSVDAFLGGVIE